MYIIWIVWGLCVFHSGLGKLHLSSMYLNWTNSIIGCGERTIATLHNTLLNSSEWSTIDLDSKGAWLGSYYMVTPFYWTRGRCFQLNSSAVREAPRKIFKSITAEKCAFFCATQASLVKYIALQDTNCFCLDKKPENLFPNGCKTNCTNVLNEKCGSVKRNSTFAYRRLEGSQESGIRRFNKTTELQTNCFMLFVDDSSGERKVYFDQEKCSSKRSFICRRERPEKVSSIIEPQKTFYDSSEHCKGLNMTLAYLTLRDTTTDRSLISSLLPGTNYWIGLRRFSSFVSIDGSNVPFETPNKCIAVIKERTGIVKRLQNCSTELKYVCRKDQINIGTTSTQTIVVNKNGIPSGEVNTKSTVNRSDTTANKEGLRVEPTSSSTSIGSIIGGIIGVAVILALICILVFCLYKRKSKNLKRTPSYREPQVEYSSKRKDSEFEVLNTSGNNNKVGTPPSKPVRRTKSGKGSVKGTEYENIVLELEDPKLLTKAISQGSNGSRLVSRMKTEAESEYSHIQGKDQKSYLPNDQENHYDSGKTVKAEANVNDIHGESETEYDVMNRDRYRETEDPNTEYDHIQNVINSKNNPT